MQFVNTTSLSLRLCQSLQASLITITIIHHNVLLCPRKKENILEENQIFKLETKPSKPFVSLVISSSFSHYHFLVFNSNDEAIKLWKFFRVSFALIFKHLTRVFQFEITNEINLRNLLFVDISALDFLLHQPRMFFFTTIKSTMEEK